MNALICLAVQQPPVETPASLAHHTGVCVNIIPCLHFNPAFKPRINLHRSCSHDRQVKITCLIYWYIFRSCLAFVTYFTSGSTAWEKM